MDRTLIGLTGNIATGKSVVRRMLVNHGALGLDADLIAHRTLYPGSRAYHPVIQAFGRDVLAPNGDINRAKLGEIVFSDPQKLEILETLTHPAVTADIRERIAAARLPLVVIEAIKLLETPLADLCQSIWISQASEAHQMERLLHARHMTEAQARQRISAQPPQAEKRQRANVVINTEGDFRATWRQIRQALNDTIQAESVLPPPYINIDQKWTASPAGALSDEALEDFWQAHSGQTVEALYETLAFNTVQAVAEGAKPRALLVCEDWNFTSTLKAVLIAPEAQLPLAAILNAFEAAALRRQSEFLILSDPVSRAAFAGLNPADFGFEPKLAEQVSFTAWRQAIARAAGQPGDPVWAKAIAQPFGQS
jgi:dephospho-CoA kinase